MGAVRTATPTAVITATRGDAPLESYSVSVNTSPQLVDVNKLCVIEGEFYAGRDQSGAVVGTVNFVSGISK